jgi:hypothetical protein
MAGQKFNECCPNKSKLIKIINTLVEEIGLNPMEKMVIQAGISYINANITEPQAERILKALKKALKDV